MTAKTFANWCIRSRPRLRRCVLLTLAGLTSIWALTSCATGTKPIPAAPLPPPPPPSIPANLRQPCPQLPILDKAKPILILQQHDQEAALYQDCRSAKSRLDQAATEWEATAWRWYCQAVKAAGVQAKVCPSD